MAQIGRAGVDTAEYNQHILKVARDSLDISKQTLRQGKVLEESFATRARQEPAPGASFADAKPELPASASPDLPAQADAAARVAARAHQAQIPARQDATVSGANFRILKEERETASVSAPALGPRAEPPLQPIERGAQHAPIEGTKSGHTQGRRSPAALDGRGPDAMTLGGVTRGR